MTEEFKTISRPRPEGAGRPSELTVRDQKILLLLGEHGCVTADRIKAHFWNNNPMSRAHFRRLAILKRRNLIENVEGDGGANIGYRLTRKGRALFSEMFTSWCDPPTRRGYKTQFEHDQLLIDLRHIFTTSLIVTDFKTEPEVRRELMTTQVQRQHWEKRPLVPDATFVMNVPAKKMRVAIELELTAKAKPRYTRIFRNHLLTKNWQLVFYVVKDELLRKRLMEHLSEVKRTDIHVRIEKSVNGIYFCGLDEFLKSRLDTPFINGKKEISLNQIAQSYGLKP